MSYVSNCLADIEMRAKQRAALESEQCAFLRRGGKITEVPGFTAIPPTLTQQQRIAVSVAEAGAKLSAWRSSDGRHNNRNAKRLKKEVAE
jgi:heme-degrading monooxygenase HmoA